MKIVKYLIYFAVVLAAGYFLYSAYVKYKALDDKIFSIEYELIQNREALQAAAAGKRTALETNYTSLPSEIVRRNELPAGVVLRLHDGMCLACYFANIKYLTEQLAEKNIPLTVWGAYASSAVFERELKDLNGGGFKGVNDTRFRDWLPDTRNTPYVFVLSDDGKVSDVFFVEKGDPSLVDRYVCMLERN